MRIPSSLARLRLTLQLKAKHTLAHITRSKSGFFNLILDSKPHIPLKASVKARLRDG
jgi:hypothetical protein